LLKIDKNKNKPEKLLILNALRQFFGFFRSNIINCIARLITNIRKREENKFIPKSFKKRNVTNIIIKE
tara:strand:- start:43 stop:246 length:204 start_codon:yes stop_codon:yes gene_type:complete